MKSIIHRLLKKGAVSKETQTDIVVELKKDEIDLDKTPKSGIKNKTTDGRSSQMTESNGMNRTDGNDMKN
jgi:hypothetical protein